MNYEIANTSKTTYFKASPPSLTIENRSYLRNPSDHEGTL